MVFSDSPANAWRHNKRYYLLYTHRFCGKCEQLKNTKHHKLFWMCGRKKEHFESETWRRHSETFVQKKHVRRWLLCLCKHHFQTWCIGDFDRMGTVDTNQVVPNEPLLNFWIPLQYRRTIFMDKIWYESCLSSVMEIEIGCILSVSFNFLFIFTCSGSAWVSLSFLHRKQIWSLGLCF